MSGVKVAGSATGAGNFTVTPPNGGATDRTLTLPDRTGTLTMDGPIFSAYKSAATQAISASTWTVVVLDAEETDSDSVFNNTGATVGGIPAYSFKPTVAGWYLFTGAAHTTSDSNQIFCAVFKNSAEAKRGSVFGNITNTGRSTVLSTLVYLNGSTDYVDFRFNVTSVTTTIQNGANATYFQGVFVHP